MGGLRRGFDGTSKILLKGFILLPNIKSILSISEWASHRTRDLRVQFEFADVKIKNIFHPWGLYCTMWKR